MVQVILIMAVTVDGKIAKYAAQPADWTSSADKRAFVKATKQAGVIVMGDKTYQTIGRPLPGRLNIVLSSRPEAARNISGQLEFSDLSPIRLIKDLENRGFDKIVLAGGATTNTLFLKESLIDEIWLTIEPKIFGQGLSLFKDVDVNLDLELIEVKRLDKNVIQVRYRLKSKNLS